MCADLHGDIVVVGKPTGDTSMDGYQLDKLGQSATRFVLCLISAILFWNIHVL